VRPVPDEVMGWGDRYFDALNFLVHLSTDEVQGVVFRHVQRCPHGCRPDPDWPRDRAEVHASCAVGEALVQTLELRWIHSQPESCAHCAHASAEVELCGQLLLCRRCRARHVDILGERGLATLADVLAQHGGPPSTGG
jgi:hypothetical protein